MVKMKILPEPTVKMNVGTEIIDMSEEAYEKAYSDGYDKGYSNGHSNGTAEGVEQGKKAEWNAYWDGYQDYGNRGNWAQAFYNLGWDDSTYNPKHAIKGGKNENCNAIFSYSRITDTKVPIDLSLASSAVSLFSNCFYLKTIRLLKVSENLSISSWFYKCSELESITFEGVIGQNGLNLQYSPKLTHDSLMSVINVLKDNSGTDTWNTITLGAANLAKLTEAELEIMTNKQWDYS